MIAVFVTDTLLTVVPAAVSVVAVRPDTESTVALSVLPVVEAPGISRTSPIAKGTGVVKVTTAEPRVMLPIALTAGTAAVWISDAVEPAT
jgi:hypothetical protein